MSLEIFNFRWFYGSEKLFFSMKLLIKLDRQKTKKIPHTVLETIILQIISQNFCKIELKPEELQLLEYALVITFLKKVVSSCNHTEIDYDWLKRQSN